jgi:hypothetical protein
VVFALAWLAPLAAWLNPTQAMERRLTAAHALEAGLRQELATLQVDFAGDILGCATAGLPTAVPPRPRP